MRGKGVGTTRRAGRVRAAIGVGHGSGKVKAQEAQTGRE